MGNTWSTIKVKLIRSCVDSDYNCEHYNQNDEECGNGTEGEPNQQSTSGEHVVFIHSSTNSIIR